MNYLSLTNFRNYARLELYLPDRLTVIQGANAQGKTNLLDAIHLLATGRSPRAGTERELINWLALEGPLPYARLAGEIGDGQQTQKLEVVVEALRNGTGNGATARKQVRINGAPKRGLDLVGRLRVVLFLPEDISLVAGAPNERRRYLDIALCQISPHYCRALSEYNRVITQRNALLKQLRERGGDRHQIGFWNSRLAEHGSVLIEHRQQAVQALNGIAAGRHRELTGGSELLQTTYLSTIDLHLARRRQAGGASAQASPPEPAPPSLFPMPQTTWESRPPSRAEIKEAFLAGLQQLQARETAAGTSLLGPHRDDMSFSVDGHDLRTFGSRGQQRTAALALKLAEVQLMQEATGESPLLLLDDVMSELDEHRRSTLLGALAGVAQAIVTTTDWSDFDPELLSHARTLRVENGTLSPANPVP